MADNMPLDDPSLAAIHVLQQQVRGLLFLPLAVQQMNRQVQSLQGGALEPVSRIAGYKLNAGFTDPMAAGGSTYIGRAQNLLAGKGIAFSRPANSPFLMIDAGGGKNMNADYVVDSNGYGTHLLLFGTTGALAQAITDGADRFIWVCTTHVENVAATSTQGSLTAGQTITIASGVHERATINKNFSGGALFTLATVATTERIIWQNIRFTTAFADPWMVGINGATTPAMEFNGVEWATSGGATYSYLFDNVNVVSVSNTVNTLTMRECRGTLTNVISLGATSNSIGSFLMEDCILTVDTVEKRVSGTSINWGMGGSTIFRGNTLTVSNYLIHANYDHYIQIVGNQFSHSGGTQFIITGLVQHGSHIAITGNQYHASTAGAVFAQLGSATGSVVNVLCFGNALTGPGSGTAIGTSFVNLGSAPVSIELWPNTYDAWTTNFDGAYGGGSLFTTTPGITVPSIVVGPGTGAGPTTPTPGSIIDIISPTTPGAGLTLLLPRFPTTAEPGTPVNGMFFYNTTTNRFMGYENSQWATLVTNEGEGLRYPLLLGRSGGNIFTGYASWGTDIGSTGYSSTVTGIAGLQAYWRMGEASGNLADTTANANTAVTNGTPTYGVTGLLTSDTNTAISLNGNDANFFSVVNSASTNVADVFSLIAWIKPTTGALMRLATRGTNSFDVSVDATGHLQLAKAGVAFICTATVAMSSGTAHMIAVTKNGAAVHLYLDGVDVSGVVTNATLSAAGSATHIGRHVLGNGWPWNGVIDEMALWNIALTAGNVTSLYTAGTATAPAPTHMSDGDLSFVRLFLANPLNTFSTGLQSAATTNNIIYTLPLTDPTVGQVLTAAAPVAGVSVLSWAGGSTTTPTTTGVLPVDWNAWPIVTAARLDFFEPDDSDNAPTVEKFGTGRNIARIHLDNYALLAGREEGQTLYGSGEPEQDLVFRSTSNDALGRIIFGDPDDEAFVFEEDGGRLLTQTQAMQGYLYVGPNVGSIPLNTNPGDATLDGRVVFSNIGLTVHNQFYMRALSAALPIINFDDTDYFQFNRTTDVFSYIIDGSTSVDFTGTAMVVYGQMTIGNRIFTTPDTFLFVAADATTPRIQFDSNDLFQYDRTNNIFEWAIAGALISEIDGVGNFRTGGYIWAGSVAPPNNVTAGDISGARLSVGNVAIQTGAIANIVGALDLNNIALPTNPAANYIREFAFAKATGAYQDTPRWLDTSGHDSGPTMRGHTLIPQPFMDATGVAGVLLASSAVSGLTGKIVVDTPITLHSICYKVTVAAIGAGTITRVALYTESGSLITGTNTTDAVGVATGVRTVTLGADVYLPAGIYYAFICSQTDGATNPTVATWTALDSSYMSTSDVLAGTVVVAAGAAPSPLGTITAVANDCPYFYLIGAAT